MLTSASTRTTLTRRSWKIPWRRRRPAIRSVPFLKKDTRKAKTDGSSQNWDSKYTSWTFLYEEFKKIKALNKRLLIVLFECLLILLTTRVVIDSYKKFYPLIPSKVTFVTALREHLLQHKGNLLGNIYTTKVPSNCKWIVIYRVTQIKICYFKWL